MNDARQPFGDYGHMPAQLASCDGARHLVGSPTRRSPRNTAGLAVKAACGR